MMKKILRASIISFLSLLVFSCDNKEEEVTFSYNSIIDKEYRFSIGRVIPVTIGKSIETDGDISLDSRFFFYSSNREGGNFDIYLRSMRDITTVRLTSHPSKDISPAVSPNGRNVAFVSFRDDPEGDIFLLNLKPADLIKKAADSTTRLPSMDSSAVNFTLEKNRDTDVVINIKDSSPAWSPDGRLIAWSSSRGNITGDTDIWVMDSKGNNKRKITSGGADFPAFSPDGEKIIFVSYRENRNGDIYSININSGKEKQITADNHIKMNPSYAGNSDEIIYSSIEADTNRNSILDLQDRSVIRYHNIKSGITYPLTRRSLSSFKAKWLPVLQTRDYNGVIIFTDIRDESINLNIIPEKGIVPKKLNARQQYDICDDYLNEYDDPEKYAMALESVFYFFGDKKDPASRAYVNRALGEAASYYLKTGNKSAAESMLSFLRKRTAEKDIYAEVVLENINRPGAGLRPDEVNRRISRLTVDEKTRYFAPFALEDIADSAFSSGDKVSALRIYSTIINDYPKFERILDIRTKAALSGDDLRKGSLSESAVKIINDGRTNQKIGLIKHLAEVFEDKKFTPPLTAEYLRGLERLKKNQSSSKKIMALLHYTSGLLLDSRGDRNDAAKEYTLSIEASHPNDITFYLSNIRLGDIARDNREASEAEKYYSAAINRYSRRFKTENFREKLLWTINHYEQTGERNEAVENFKEASSIYEKYINMITLTYNKRLFTDVYSEYAPRAHILYIDSLISLKGTPAIAELEKAYTDRLPIYRMDFNKAALYGLAYIYTQKGLSYMHEADSPGKSVSIDDAMKALEDADQQIEWALFIDDTFIEPYLLKTWIYQYIDTERKNRGRSDNSVIGKYFPERLWEENIQILEKALDANNEALYPENEGNINLNMANNYFLLLNYPRALRHYREAARYKQRFNSEIEKALFHFHYGYCYWQNGETGPARAEIQKAYNIYSTLAASAPAKEFANQHLILYRYFALLSRYDGKYDEAINWYQRILTFADNNSLSVDRARYLQEIAHCYMENGELETATIFINRAGAMLKNYPDDERKYYLNIRLFGIGPIPLFNMGPDNAVIGNNRIFHPLDRNDKRLLNIAMLEDISLKNNDYSAAIEFQKAKLKLLEKSKTSLAVETKIRSLNNIGYYYYEMGRFNDAEKYFNQSRSTASAGNNLEGLFTSIMNLTNLYALLIENNLSPERNWIKDTETLAASLDNYRNSYYDLRLKEERTALEEAAKAKKEKVDPEEITKLKASIEAETADKYFSLDIASGILKFYRGELLFNTLLKDSGDDLKTSLQILKNNHTIYTLYAESLATFENSYEIAKSRGLKPLMTRLLFNMAVSYEKTGDMEKAYVALIDAKNLADQNRYTWLQIDASYRMARFLASSGKDVEKGDFRAMAGAQYASAVSRIEELPLLYAVHQNRINSLYDDYINFLADSGNMVRAFNVSGKKLQISRLMSINTLSPKFSNEELTTRYYAYNSRLRKLDQVNRSISRLIESGAERNRAGIESFEKEGAAIKGDLRRFAAAIAGIDPLYNSYITAGDLNIPTLQNDVYKFHNTDKDLVFWRISGGRLSSGTVPSGEGITDIIEKNSGTSPVFIILNETALSILSGKDKKPASARLITGLDRAAFFSSAESRMALSLLSSEKDIAGKIKTPGADAHTKTPGKNLRDFSVLIENSKNQDALTPEILFLSQGISPSALIMITENPGYNYTAAMLEAGLYAGIPSVILSLTQNSDSIANLADSFFSGTEVTIDSSSFIITGNIHSFTDKSSKGDAAAEFARFNRAMSIQQFDTARMHLSRWNSLNSTRDSFDYYASLWLLELLKGDFPEADKALMSIKGASDEESKGILVRKVYQALYTGDFNSAGRLFTTGEERIKDYSDTLFIKGFLTFAEEGPARSLDKINSIEKPYNTLLPAERYLLLFSRYLAASNPAGAEAIAEALPGSILMSFNESLSPQIPWKTGELNISDRRYRSIAPLKKEKKNLSHLKESVLRNSVTSQGYDRYSPFPLIYALINHEIYGVDDELFPLLPNLDIPEIIASSEKPDSLYLLSLLEELHIRHGRHAAAIPLQDMILKLSRESGLSHLTGQTLFRKALSSMIAEDMGSAYKTALEADKTIKTGEENHIDLQLLIMNLQIRSSQFRAAAEKGNTLASIENLSVPHRYMLNLQLSLLELNRLSTLKSASKADAEKFENLFLSSAAMLRNDISILSREGYREISEQVFDEYINYKMRTGQHSDAHLYNEFKKLADISLKTGKNFLRDSGTIDIQALQQALPADSVYVNISRNKNDLFVWVFDRSARRALVIDKGYSKTSDFLKSYKPASMQRSDASRASSELQDILLPLMKLVEGKKNIIFSPDLFTENIPFETAGKKSILADNADIFYMVSPMLTDFRSIKTAPLLYTAGTADSVNAELEIAGIRHSGIEQKSIGRVTSGLAHITGEVRYNRKSRGFTIDSRSYGALVSGADMVYVSAQFADYGQINLAAFNHGLGTGIVLINASPLQDVNNAFFAETFYSSIKKGISIPGSFTAAQKEVRGRERFAGPGYWAGTRLYINNFSFGN